MNLSELDKITTKRKKRVGQGHGSGRGKTAGRGMKGQKARNKVPLDFEGGALPLIKRLPFLRGKGKNKPRREKPHVINVSALNAFSDKSTVDLESLKQQKLLPVETVDETRVKILGDGELHVALTVKLPASKSAADKIKQAGGSLAS